MARGKKKSGKVESAFGGATAPTARTVGRTTSATKGMILLLGLLFIGVLAVAFLFFQTKEPPPPAVICVARANTDIPKGAAVTAGQINREPNAVIQLVEVPAEVINHDRRIMFAPHCDPLREAMTEGASEAFVDYDLNDTLTSTDDWLISDKASKYPIWTGDLIRKEPFTTPSNAFLSQLRRDADGNLLESLVRLTIPPGNALLGTFSAGDKVDVVLAAYSGQDASPSLDGQATVIIARNMEIMHTTVSVSILDSVQSEQIAAAREGAPGTVSVANRVPVGAVPTTYMLKGSHEEVLSLMGAEAKGSLHLIPASPPRSLSVATAITSICIQEVRPLAECSTDPGVTAYNRLGRSG